MSAAVRAALAAKRAEHRSRSVSPSKPNTSLPNGDGDDTARKNLLPNFGRDLDASIASPFGSPKPAAKRLGAAPERVSVSPSPDVSLNQKSEEDIVQLSIQNGKVNLSSRSPSLKEVPALLLSLLADEPPSWFLQIPEDDRQPWYMREEVHTLQLSNNELASLPDKLAEFRGLKRLELHSNRLTSLPANFFQLSTLTTLTLSKNSLTSIPQCLLALDNLVTLDLSHNKIQTLWKEDDVVAARSQREAWDKENAAQENGVWAGLSPTKKDRKTLVTTSEAQQKAPMRSLRTLDLSHNRLTNAALGIPDLANRRSKASAANETALVRLPAGLKTLNLGYNHIRGPVSTSLFQDLALLEDLGLSGCGIADDVLTSEGSADSHQALARLSILDLSGCELDDLSKVEALFGSQRIQSFDQAIGNVDPAPFTQEKVGPAQGIPARQLVRVLNRPTSADIERMDERCGGKVLCLLLEGNPLREEAFRQKRGGRSGVSPEKKASAASTATQGTNANRAAAAAAATASPTAPATASPAILAPSASAAPTAASSQLPAKPQIVKEDWEILAEQGLNTELGRRKLRIEQARREQEAAAAAAAASKDSEANTGEEVQSRGRKPRAADDATGSDADAEFAASGSGAESRERDEDGDDKDGGSALASAKLSTKKKEALGQVPCKFFRSNGCSAGASCPFAHTLPGDGGQKSVCQWFLKGNCRFGHKCALAHVLPGQPMSMDRKNKRAAQHGQPLPQAPGQQTMAMVVAAGGNGGGQQQQQQQQQTPVKPSSQRQVSGQQTQTQTQAGSQLPLPPQQGTPTRPALVSGGTPSQIPAQVRHRPASFTTRDHDLPFGLPDDLQSSAPSTADPARAGFEGIHIGSQNIPESSRSTSFAGSTSFRRPGSLSHSLSASLAGQQYGGMDSAAAAFGTSASASRAFGTSPFSHPGGHGLFFSGSQDSEGGAGPFARSNRDVFGVRSIGRTDDTAKLWAGQPISRGDALGGSKEEEEIEDAEDFLPSSLSDLLTPAELDRRRRSTRLSSSFAGNDERITVAQSMPSHAGHGFGSSSLGFGRSAIGAERTKSSNLSTGFAQQQQKPSASEEYRPFGDGRRASGLDSIAFRESGSGLSTSASRTAAHHAPGQSLPQGLAAGLSRLHLRTGGSGGGQTSGSFASGGFGSIGSTTGNENNSAGVGNVLSQGSVFSSSFNQNAHNPNAGLRVPGSLDDYGLGPTAPSSVLPHRSPLTFAVGSNTAPGSGRLSGSFADRHLNGGSAAFGSPGGSPFSPPLSAIGSHRNAGAGEGGIAIPEGGAQKPTSATRYAHHPATHRLRAGSSAAAPHSPLTLPVATAEEDEEEAIFELE